jgi:16S rRNA (cytosine1402-N4)-methyltransferase
VIFLQTGDDSVSDFHHIPVLTQELVTGLNTQPHGIYLDATVGGGGHSQLLLERYPDIRVVAIDQDSSAIAAARQRLSPYGERVQYWLGNFSEYCPDIHGSLWTGTEGKNGFDGIMADLGVSSAQLDQAERGFSFRHEGLLDMRMDRRHSHTAADIINQWSEKDLADLFFTYGEERLSRRIARQIVRLRPLYTTTALADAIAHCVPHAYRYGRIHPATRVFQALRIAVNQELFVLEWFVSHAPAWLKSGGRIGIISFHSLEDRIVKQGFRTSSWLQPVTKKPIIASAHEWEHNPRSRSAKLRLAVKLEG